MFFKRINKYLEYLIIFALAISYLLLVYLYSHFAYSNLSKYQQKLFATAVERNDKGLETEVKNLLAQDELLRANELLMMSQIEINIAAKKGLIKKKLETEQKNLEETRHAEELTKQEAVAVAMAQRNRTPYLGSSIKVNTTNCSKDELYVVINVTNNTEQIFKGDPDCKTGSLIESRSVATGAHETCYNPSTGSNYYCATPRNKWVIEEKEESSGEFGPWFLRLKDLRGIWGSYYALHGTDDESSIGKWASHGCIRHYNADIIHLYNLLPVGTIVWTE